MPGPARAIPAPEGDQVLDLTGGVKQPFKLSLSVLFPSILWFLLC